MKTIDSILEWIVDYFFDEGYENNFDCGNCPHLPESLQEQAD